MQPTPLKERGQLARRIDLSRLLEETARLAPGTVQQEKRKRIDDDVVEHDRRNDFVHPERCLQDRRQSCIEGAADHGTSDHDRKLDEGGHARRRALAPIGKHRAGKHLAFCPDVPDAGPEGDGCRKAGEDQRGRLHQRLRHGAPGAEGALREGKQGGRGVGASREKQETRCQGRAQHGGSERQQPRRDPAFRSRFEPPSGALEQRHTPALRRAWS